MKKIKMFYSVSISDLEKEVNKWLMENQSVKICKFLQTYGNGGTYVSIIYAIGPLA